MGQGGSDIKYIKVADLDDKFLDQDVRIDFKSKQTDSRHVMRDTMTLEIDAEKLTIAEKRKRGVDYWYYDDQYLESIDKGDRRTIKIFDARIKELTVDSIKFSLTIETFDAGEKMKTETKDIWIAKKTLDGVMIKIGE